MTARFHARDGASNDELASVLDTSETLLTYVLSKEGMTEMFDQQLQALGDAYPQFAGIAGDYHGQFTNS